MRLRRSPIQTLGREIAGLSVLVRVEPTCASEGMVNLASSTISIYTVDKARVHVLVPVGVAGTMTTDQPSAGRHGNRKGEERRQSILDFHYSFEEEHGYSPSEREIADAVGLRSISTVSYHLTVLQQTGQLSRDAGRARSGVVKLFPPRAPEVRAEVAGIMPTSLGAQDIASVQFFDRIAAGTPVIANSEPEDTLPLPRALVGYGDVIAVNVTGDSMINAGIFDGDIAFVRCQDAARNGDIVAARFEDEVTVKTFRVMNDRVWLFPQNPRYEPFPGDTWRIMGKVVGAYRRF
jgi:repressor LexA